MDTKQKRREQKLKRREKIRQQHLDRDRHSRENDAFNRFFAARTIIQSGAPDKNDREGWARYNALNLKEVMKMAFKINGRDRVLQRFVEDPNTVSKYDLETVEALLTQAAQKICCSVPYFIPTIILTKHSEGVNIRQPHFKLDKIHTPLGLAWHFEDYEGGMPITFIGGKVRLFTLSTHMIDRMVERVIRPCCIPPTEVSNMMRTVRPEKVVIVQPNPVLPLTCGTETRRFLLGYCPYDEHKHMVIAKSLLLPTMRGTPEYDKLVAKGLEAHSAQDLNMLHEKFDFFKENGVFDGLDHYTKAGIEGQLGV
jgi:hypothetical protein